MLLKMTGCGNWCVEGRIRPFFLTFQKTKDKAQSSFGTFGIPFGVSGPRPLQEARFIADQTVPAGFFFHNRDASVLFVLLASRERMISRIR